jgi:hypothetical protein
MGLALPEKTVTVICSLLIILSISGGCTLNKENSPANQTTYEIDAWCEIQEFNLTLMHNRTIVPVTEEDLRPFPEFGLPMTEGDQPPPAGNSGTRVVGVVDCNASRAIQFLTLSRKYEEFPNQPVLEYHGHFYRMSYEYLHGMPPPPTTLTEK